MPLCQHTKTVAFSTSAPPQMSISRQTFDPLTYTHRVYFERKQKKKKISLQQHKKVYNTQEKHDISKAKKDAFGNPDCHNIHVLDFGICK